MWYAVAFSPLSVTEALHVLVDRDDVTNVRTERTPVLEPAMGEILVRVNRVALTANNVTYAVTADRLPYYEFFPGPPGWGRVPVWGFGDVVASNAPGIEPGERIFGFWPASTHVVLTPDRTTQRTFFDGAEHRAGLPAAYNSYSRVAADPTYREHEEGRVAVFRPLFLTSFLLAEHLGLEPPAEHDSALAQAEQVVISSASSKTALGLAHLLSPDRVTLGITAPQNQAFIASLGMYHGVYAYEDADQLPQATTVYVDISGNPEVRNRIRDRLGPLLVGDVAVGIADWSASAPSASSPQPDGSGSWTGVTPQFFFAPSHFVRLVQGENSTAVWSRYGVAWRDFMMAIEPHVQILELNGIEALAGTFTALVGGGVAPSTAVVVRF